MLYFNIAIEFATFSSAVVENRSGKRYNKRNDLIRVYCIAYSAIG